MAKEIADILGAKTRRDGFYEGNGYRVTWTFGHLCTLKEPNDYTPMWQRWSLSSLPMIPPRFGIKLIDDKGIEKQFGIIEKIMHEADTIVNCGDAGQEGELIQRWVMQKARVTCPVKRLWVSSLTEEAIREGFARGILSNEAGVGTSAMAHSRSRGREPHRAGLFAMCEVVFDSLLLCLLTGFAILLAVPDISSFRTPMSLVSHAFSSVLGGISDFVLPILILAFAYATVICWYFYGRECTEMYFPRIRAAFPVAFVLFAFASSLLASDFLLYVIDILLTLMSIMTLSAIIKRTPDIVKIQQRSQRKNPE